MPKYKLTEDDITLGSSVTGKDSKQLSSPGVMVSGGQIIQQSEWDAANWQDIVKDIIRMRNGDCLANSCLKVLKAPALLSDYTIGSDVITNRTQEIVDYLYYCFGLFNERSYRRHLLMAIDFGFMVFEIVTNVIEYNGKKTKVITKLSPIQYDTINQFLYEGIDLAGIEHYRRLPDGTSDLITIPIEKLFIFSFLPEFENVTGSPILRPARTVHNMKEKLLRTYTNGAIKGTGLPHVEYERTVDTATKAEIIKMLKTIAISPEAYISSHKGFYSIKFEQVQMIQSIQQMLEYLDKQMLFLTSSQFSAIGLTTSGSYASSKESRSLYELSVQGIIGEIEAKNNKLLKLMLDYSYLADRSPDEDQNFKINYKNADLRQVADNLQKVFKLIPMTQDDQVQIRQIFDLPEAQEIVTPAEKTTDENTEDQAPAQDQQMSKKMGTIKLSREPNKRELSRIELASAVEHYETTSVKAQAIINEVYSKILKDCYRQYQAGKTEFDFENRKIELLNRLKHLYTQGLDRGKSDVKKELQKAGGTKLNNDIVLSTKEPRFVRTISNQIDSLFVKTRAMIEAQVDRLGDNKGTLGTFIGFENNLPDEKNRLTNIVEKSYTDGRSEELISNKDKIAIYGYSAIFDKNLCNECSKLDSIEFTADDAKDLGINLSGKDVNQNCLGHKGGNECRCMIYIVEAK